MAAADRMEEVRRRLRNDYIYFPERALRIVSKAGEEIPFLLKPPQKRLAVALMRQRDAGQPQRARILKARQVGFSTQTQGLGIQRATQIPHHHFRVVAQDKDTAGSVFGIGRFMWEELPADIRPELAYERNSDQAKFLQFGAPSLMARRAGERGLGSRITIDTERSPSGGRGMTIRTLHLSERAFWEREGKALALMNAVPDDPDTLVIDESTANGHNAFKDGWDEAVAGTDGFYPCFTPWFEELEYRRRFLSVEQRAEFEATLGQGARREEEPKLVTLIAAKLAEWRDETFVDWNGETQRFHPLEELGAAGGDDERLRILEHLHWREWAIGAKCEGSVQKFHQEYPSTPEEAFLSTGRRAFDPEQVRVVLARTAREKPARGALVATESKQVRVRHGVIDVPTAVAWKPIEQLNATDRVRARWTLFAVPDEGDADEGRPAGQYVAALDPRSDEENGVDPKTGRPLLAEHAISVIDHRTLAQVATWASGIHDADEAGRELLLACLFFNRAHLVVEKTGGYGMSILRWAAREARYPHVYRTAKKDRRDFDDTADPLGWSTDAKTKPMMRDRGRELLRDGRDGLRCHATALQMLTYVVDERGRMAPEAGKLADRLMAWLIAQMVAMEKPIRPDRPAGAVSYTRNVGQRYGR